jgi:hypothetical protein
MGMEKMADPTCPDDCFMLANAMADAARKIIRPHFRKRLTIDPKWIRAR